MCGHPGESQNRALLYWLDQRHSRLRINEYQYRMSQAGMSVNGPVFDLVAASAAGLMHQVWKRPAVCWRKDGRATVMRRGREKRPLFHV